MSDSTGGASLDSLSTEMLAIMFPDSINLDVPFDEQMDLEALADLHALAQTCRRLYAAARPLVWAKVQVTTVRQLGELRELINESPSIASLIKSFRFIWDMDGDCTEKKLQLFPEDMGSVLDLAFIDRLAHWDAIRKQLRKERFNFILAGEVLYYSKKNSPGKYCIPPGQEPDWDAVMKVAKRGLGHYPWAAGGRGNGPDGVGQDNIVLNAVTFTSCIIDVVSKLSCLQTFGWETPVLPMPRPIFNALSRLNNLKDLRLVLSTYRGNYTGLPFWQLAGKLETLDIRNESALSEPLPYSVVGATEKELFYADLESQLQSPSAYFAQFGGAVKAQIGVHVNTACRTIVTAARGGRLKRLAPFTHSYAFRIRALLPYWLQIIDWGQQPELTSWGGAARWLRPFLAHASFRQDWLREASSNNGTAGNRTLTLQDLRTIKAQTDGGGKLETWGNGISLACVVRLYLPWLVAGGEIAEQVLDAWNAIVARGEADEMKCACPKCDRYYRFGHF